MLKSIIYEICRDVSLIQKVSIYIFHAISALAVAIIMVYQM